MSCILSSKIDVELNLDDLTFMCIIIYYMYMYIRCGYHGYEVSHYSTCTYKLLCYSIIMY